MINAGAIMCASLLEPEAEAADVSGRFLVFHLNIFFVNNKL